MYHAIIRGLALAMLTTGCSASLRFPAGRSCSRHR